MGDRSFGRKQWAAKRHDKIELNTIMKLMDILETEDGLDRIERQRLMRVCSPVSVAALDKAPKWRIVLMGI